MAAADEIFNSTKLEVIVPEESLEIPSEPIADDWLYSLANVKQRDKAFFDERLLLFFTVKTPHPGPEAIDPSTPPLELVQFLSHLQITLDAKYIAPQQQPQQHHRGAATAPGTGRGISLALPPRTHSHRNSGRAPPGNHPSIFPPHTPNPTPQTDEADRKYATSSTRAEGTVLESFVWGETQREEPAERSFALLWSSAENVWVAVYRLTVGVSFLRTSVTEPLLSLTVSTTLREKPLKMTPERQVLAALLNAAGGGQSASDAAPVTVNGVEESPAQDGELHGLEEVNLFDGLSQGPTFGGPSGVPLTLPSVRLAASLRRAAYSLPPVQPESPNLAATPINTSARGHQTRGSNILRKSFLKTLQTVSGFQIRMKSVFVPYVVLPGSAQEEGERHQAGSEERTVVLSVELGNGSVSRGPGATGFAVEGVDVTVGGEGATANLIGWGERGFTSSDAVFPLLMGPVEQFNLLYAITFLRQSETDDVADTMRGDVTGANVPAPVGGDAQRPVSIVIRGRPFDLESSSIDSEDAKSLSYPTQTFRSRWNCVLDLSSGSQNEAFSQNFDVTSEPLSSRDALPAPASPFPATPTTARLPADKVASATPPTPTLAVAGSKRHTIGGLAERGHRVAMPNARYRASTSMVGVSDVNSSPISSVVPLSSAGGRFTPSLPSLIISNMPSSPAPRTPGAKPPPTPAYPAYPSEVVPNVPVAHSPIANLRAAAGTPTSVEPRRERKIMQGGTPQTPAPHMLGTYFTDSAAFPDPDEGGDPVVVSVGLAPPGELKAYDLDTIYAFDTFGIEIFVFNRSERTRRFEVSYPERRRRRQGAAPDSFAMSDSTERQAPGILPLENRIRIGPLRPHTCQSVRMQFLAMQPGVHSIHSLILTDVETGYSKNLKSVMDVFVHDADDA